MTSNILIFAGPTLDHNSKDLIKKSGIQLYPPVQRNNLRVLLEKNFRGTIILVDGFFSQVMAIGHMEIRESIENGCTVFGLSSMGAIRAFELRRLGMKGYGKTYEWFFKMEDFQDDEVALLHSPAPDYQALSEPLVHFRECVIDLTHNNQLSKESAKEIIDEMKSRYYGDRTKDLFFDLLRKHSKIDQQRQINFEKYQIKNLDLVSFLEHRVWDC